MATPRMMIVLFGGVALVVGAVLALMLESWWVLVAVMAIHALGTALVIGFAWSHASDTGDKPDPVTQARLEEEGAGRKPPRANRAAGDREVFS